MRPTDFQNFIADEGYILAPDFAKKRKALQKAARRGDVAAQRSLGIMSCHGLGVPQNLTEAAKWFQKAADQGDCEAQFLLGQMYWAGEGVPQDTELAARWFQKAADQGDAGAQHVLGCFAAAAGQSNLDRAVGAARKGGVLSGETSHRQDRAADQKTSMTPFLVRATIGVNYSSRSTP